MILNFLNHNRTTFSTANSITSQFTAHPARHEDATFPLTCRLRRCTFAESACDAPSQTCRRRIRSPPGRGWRQLGARECRGFLSARHPHVGCGCVKTPRFRKRKEVIDFLYQVIFTFNPGAANHHDCQNVAFLLPCSNRTC